MNILSQKKTLYKTIEDLVAYNIDYQPNPDWSNLYGDLKKLDLKSWEVSNIMRRVAEGDF
tara:strand:- start:56 stop:235 length:180 start_codon:yes stop_codon:yes gene_type:complete